MEGSCYSKMEYELSGDDIRTGALYRQGRQPPVSLYGKHAGWMIAAIIGLFLSSLMLRGFSGQIVLSVLVFLLCAIYFYTARFAFLYKRLEVSALRNDTDRYFRVMRRIVLARHLFYPGMPCAYYILKAADYMDRGKRSVAAELAALLDDSAVSNRILQMIGEE